MKFTISGEERDLRIEHLYIAGWTGRNKDAVNHHIEELAAIGIAPPSQVPLYYRGSNALLTQDTTIEVLGSSTSGEVEPLLIQNTGDLFIGLASDHTDRKLEAYSVAASKQACPKPAASELWTFESVKDHLDSLLLRCSIEESGGWVTYQEGDLSNIRPLDELLKASGFGDDASMLCGTLGAVGGVRSALKYKMALEDPVLNRKIGLEYSVNVLPIVS